MIPGLRVPAPFGWLPLLYAPEWYALGLLVCWFVLFLGALAWLARTLVRSR
jgi:hypothetical protein